MTNIRGVVGQLQYPLQSEGGFVNARMNPRGELVTPDYFLQLVLDGNVYNASNLVQETPERISETARGSDNVNPSLLLDVPTGTTAIPLEINIEEAAGTTEDLTLTINTDDVVRRTSGGATITPVNMRKDDRNTAESTFYSGSTQIVTIVNVDDDQLYTRFIEAEATPRTTVGNRPIFSWSARDFVPPVLIGPASLLVFLIGSTDDHDWFYSVKWAEIATTHI